MAILRVKFCGLCMWVPDGQRVTVLMPSVAGHVGHIEPHVAKVLVPLRPNARAEADFDHHALDNRILHLPSASSPDGVTSHGLPLDKLALIRSVAGKGVKRALLTGPLGLAQCRVALHAGAYNGEYEAEAEFDYGGETKPLAHVLNWEMPVTDNPLPLKLLHRNGTEETFSVSEGLVEPGYIDIEVHYEPLSHFPWGNHSPTIPAPNVRAEHFVVFYDLIPASNATDVPVCRGPAPNPIKLRPTYVISGSDPVTCVHSYTDPES